MRRTKYEAEISTEAMQSNFKKIINQIYKLLPSREEGLEWELPLATVQEELAGAQRLFEIDSEKLLTVMNKLEGLFLLKGEDDFFLFRRTIFECLNLLSEVNQECQTHRN